MRHPALGLFGLVLFALSGAGSLAPATAQTDVGVGFTSAGPSGAVVADSLTANDANDGDLPNRLLLLENSGGSVAGLPAQCTETESGVTGKDCCLLGDYSVADGTEDWRMTCGTSQYHLAKPIRGGGNTDITPNTTVFLPVGGLDVSGTESKVASVVATSLGSRRVLAAECGVTEPPGAGETVTLTLRRGNCGAALANTSVVCQVSGAARTGTVVATVDFSADQCGTWQVAYSTGAAQSRPYYTVFVTN